MIFREQKIYIDKGDHEAPGYSYDVEDVFGEIHLESTEKLEADILDEIVVILLRQNTAAQTVTGEAKHKNGIIHYSFKKRPMWNDADEEESCEDTPISTEKQESVSIRTVLLNVPIIRWLVRFAVAFLAAWKSATK